MKFDNIENEFRTSASNISRQQLLHASRDAGELVDSLRDEISSVDDWNICRDLSTYIVTGRRALGRETRKSRSGHWSYDVNRHISLRKANVVQNMAFLELVAMAIGQQLKAGYGINTKKEAGRCPPL